MKIENEQIMIRHMQDEIHDYQLMAKWLTDERILEFYERIIGIKKSVRKYYQPLSTIFLQNYKRRK